MIEEPINCAKRKGSQKFMDKDDYDFPKADKEANFFSAISQFATMIIINLCLIIK